MHRNRMAKIIATIGPSSQDIEIIEKLFLAGADVFRLNFSHGTHAQHRQVFDNIRSIEKKHNHPITVLMDLQGPKLRIGKFKDTKVFLKNGAEFHLLLDEIEGDESRVSLMHPEIFAAISAGSELLLDDGKVRLVVEECSRDFAKTRVKVGGALSNNKGLNLPGSRLMISALTEKDREDLSFGLDLGVDWVALSFVQHPDDVKEARDIIKDRALIISKLEKPQAIEHLDELVEISDAIMVARGDLGVEMPPEDVPVLQRRIIQACRSKGKPVVVATQMLESMINSPTPTRAEASDVATAIYEEADAVMLSAESASGSYPIESVTMMNRIIERVEQETKNSTAIPSIGAKCDATQAITHAARDVAISIGAKAITAFTTTGRTAFQVARVRPPCPIIGISTCEDVARRLNLVWGVHPVKSRDLSSFAEAVGTAIEIALESGIVQKKEPIILTAGVPFKVAGATNILRIAYT